MAHLRVLQLAMYLVLKHRSYTERNYKSWKVKDWVHAVNMPLHIPPHIPLFLWSYLKTKKTKQINSKALKCWCLIGDCRGRVHRAQLYMQYHTLLYAVAHMHASNRLTVAINAAKHCSFVYSSRTVEVGYVHRRFKARPHWKPNAHWTGSNPVWARPHWMCIRPILIWSRLIPVHFQRWFQSGLNWIVQLHVARKDQKGRCMHARVDYRQWARFSGYTLCSTYLLKSKSNMMAG